MSIQNMDPGADNFYACLTQFPIMAGMHGLSVGQIRQILASQIRGIRQMAPWDISLAETALAPLTLEEYADGIESDRPADAFLVCFASVIAQGGIRLWHPGRNMTSTVWYSNTRNAPKIDILWSNANQEGVLNHFQPIHLPSTSLERHSDDSVIVIDDDEDLHDNEDADEHGVDDGPVGPSTGTDGADPRAGARASGNRHGRGNNAGLLRTRTFSANCCVITRKTPRSARLELTTSPCLAWNAFAWKPGRRRRSLTRVTMSVSHVSNTVSGSATR